MARIADRVSGHGCRVCELQRRILQFTDVGSTGREYENLKNLYSENNRVYFLPKYRAAIEFSDQRDYMKQHHRNNEVKNDLCLRTQIKMIRILYSNEDNYRNCLCISRVDDSYEGISESLQALFSLLHINIDIDVERDINDIRVFHLNSSDVE